MTLNILAREIQIGDYELIYRGEWGSNDGAWWMHGPLGDGFEMNDEISKAFEAHIAKFFEETL